MGAFSKFKELVGIEEIEDDEEEIEEEKEKKPLIPRQSSAPAVTPRPASPSVSSGKPAPSGSRYTSAMKMVVIEPQGFDESPENVSVDYKNETKSTGSMSEGIKSPWR